ncbi:MAG: enoyl-CoA hydratase/isomerase family protein [Candidatus Paracaedibacteraceae bacterium]|nr:enoyl-CoA hydratase/isomerase family protein [Candidatus Paracaedibacteraceae bacterium]
MHIQFSVDSKIAFITFQNNLNLLSTAFILDLNRILKECDSDINVHVIIIQSTTKIFSAGADLKEMQMLSNKETQHNGTNTSKNDPMDHWQYLATLKKPVIACIMGACLGGALEIALMCDFIIASDNATFGFPEIKLGLLPGGGGTQRILQRISLVNAKKLMFLGDSISAKTAYEWGLSDALFSQEECFNGSVQLASKLTNQSLDSQVAIKKLLHLLEHESMQSKLKTERTYFYDRLVSKEANFKINTFLNRNK